MNSFFGKFLALGVCLSLLLLGGCSTFSGREDGGLEQTAKTPEQLEAERIEQQKQAEDDEIKQSFAKAVQEQRSGSLDTARAELEGILVKRPESAAANFNLGLIERQEENLEAFESRMNAVLENNPNHKQALNALGTQARVSGDFDKAEEYYRKALDADPLYFPAVKNLAILLDLYRGRLSEALALYLQAQSLLDEPDPKLKDWIFDIERRIGQ